MNLDIFKGAAELVVSIGVGSVVGNAIKASTPANLSVIKKVSIGVGAIALTNMVGDMAAKYTTRSIEEVVEQVQNVKTAFNIASEAAEEAKHVKEDD